MELKKITTFTLAFFSCLLIGYGILYISMSENLVDSASKSIKEKALKSQVAMSQSLFKQIKKEAKDKSKNLIKSEVLLTKSQYKEKMERLMSQLSLEQEEVAKRIDLLEFEHQDLINLARRSKIKIKPIELISPSMRYYLGNYLDISSTRMNDEDLKSLKLSAEDWSYIRSFVKSKDFKALLSENRLSQNLVNPHRLKLTYQTNDNIKNRRNSF